MTPAGNRATRPSDWVCGLDLAILVRKMVINCGKPGGWGTFSDKGNMLYPAADAMHLDWVRKTRSRSLSE